MRDIILALCCTFILVLCTPVGWIGMFVLAIIWMGLK